MKFFFLCFLLSFWLVIPMEKPESDDEQDRQAESIVYEWPEPDDIDIIECFLRYVDNMEFFTQQLVILRLKRWIKQHDAKLPQAVIFETELALVPEHPPVQSIA